jgi:hypothetical protein
MSEGLGAVDEVVVNIGWWKVRSPSLSLPPRLQSDPRAVPHIHVVQVPEFVVVSGANTLKVSEYFEAIGTRATPSRNACW